jgi:choline dehydrogenase-like flavoprotein
MMNESSSFHPFIPDNAEQIVWDVIVVGTGMGGATTGYELARNGKNVLFIEKGKFLYLSADRGDGKRDINWNDEQDSRLSRGCWPLPIEGKTSFGDTAFFAPLGSGTGGSTSLYAAQLERLLLSDFEPRGNHPKITDSTLPERWPIAYKNFVDYYRRAEDMYRVRGTQDPLNFDAQSHLLEPPPLSVRDQALHDSFLEIGLNPYRAHVACEFLANCEECGGVLCPRECKNDAGRTCLMPALKQYGARILSECEVLRFEADTTTIKSVICKLNGREIALKGKIVVLAAGCLFTPVLLLNSKSALWPNGLANSSGYVGRNLMWHATDFIAIRPKRSLSTIGPKKALSLNDFYISDGVKLGNLQSVGVPVTSEYVYSFLRSKFQKAPKWQQIFVQQFLLHWVAQAAAFYFRSTAVFATITEDLPYLENRVIVAPDAKNGMRFEYKYTEDLRSRSTIFRKKITTLLKSKYKIFVLTGRNNINFGHACGTCRFGSDPITSVLNSDNRAHDIQNLYVTDASFFPSSGGTNPSLTVAANAIRVAEVINRQLGKVCRTPAAARVEK